MEAETNTPLTVQQRLERLESAIEALENHYLTHDHLNGNLVRKV